MYMFACVYMYAYILGKVTALGVLCCFALFVCLTLLASFFLPSHVHRVLKHSYLKITRARVLVKRSFNRMMSANSVCIFPPRVYVIII